MRCSDVERQLPQYADDALPAPQSEAMAAHLAGCPACREELTQLQHALAALNLAAREPAPDLWAQFQARVVQQDTSACCREIEGLLSQFSDGELDRVQTLRVRDHLAACSACTALEAALSRPLRTLEHVAKTPAKVELWPAFTARLGKSLSCRQAEGLLPSVLAGEPTAETLAFQSHVHQCPACASSVAAYEQSLGALSRVARATPEVDLWPAFSARLAEEAVARSARSPRTAWLPALGTWLRGPLWQPALGFAAFAIITVVGQMLSQSVSGRLRGTDLARLSPGMTGQIMAHQPESGLVVESTPKAKTTSAPTSNSVAKAAELGTKSVAATPISEAREPVSPPVPANDLGSELPATRRAPGIRVAFNLPSSDGELIPVPESVFPSEPAGPSTVGERDGMQAVVQVVGLLAGSEDALNSPFDAKANDK